MAGELAAALAKAQAAFPPIKKTKTVRVRTKTGGEYTFDYAPLEAVIDAVRAPLTENDLAYTQTLATLPEGVLALRTMLLHGGGERLEDLCPLPVREGMSAQEIGSLITYFRRYALTCLLGIASEDDDDGNRASGNQASAPDNSRSRPERRVEGGVTVSTPRTWAQVQESVRDCDNPDEAWAIFQAFGRAASYHLYGETNPKKLSKEQNRVMLQKAAGAAIWLHESEHVKYQGEFRYFGEPEQRGAWASVLDGHLLEIPDYKPPAKAEQADLSDEELKAEADRLVGEYEAAIRDIE